MAASAMGAFDGIFATRGNAGSPEPNPVGVFEEVFVRRGRWRKNVTEQSLSNVADLAEHVAAEAADVLYPIRESSGEDNEKPECAKTSGLLGDCSDPMLTSEIADTIQFVVKNTFLNTAGFVSDSLRGFLSERQVQSCPAGSINIDDIICKDEQELFSQDAALDTSASWQKLRTMSIDDPSFMNTAASWQKLRTMSFDDASFMPDLLDGTLFNTASTYAAYDCQQQTMPEADSQFANQDMVYNTETGLHDQARFEQQIMVEERLSTLRQSGSKIQQSIAEALAPAINRSMQFDACFSPRINLPAPMATPAFSPRVCLPAPMAPPAGPLLSTMMPVPPPPPCERAPRASAVIRLAETLPPPELGGPLAPSMGSMLHHLGECRPCTFFHTRGCQNAETCQFCHLCGPGEKKKRLRAEKSAKKEVQRVAVENARAILASLDAAERNAEVDFIVE